MEMVHAYGCQIGPGGVNSLPFYLSVQKNIISPPTDPVRP